MPKVSNASTDEGLDLDVNTQPSADSKVESKQEESTTDVQEEKKDKPKGKVKSVPKNEEKKGNYVFVSRLKHNGETYEKGDQCEVDGELEALFLKNGYIK